MNPSHLALRRLAVAVFLAVALPAATGAVASDAVPPVDQPYPGTLTVQVDLSDAPKKIFRAKETIPVKSGPVTLYYPKWIPGEHAPSGPIDNVTGLIITANGKRVPWRRDLRDMFTIHVDVPADATALDLQFQFLSPGDGGAFGASVSATPDLVDMEFNQVAFYPAGYYSRQIQTQPSVTLPAGWRFASALEVAGQSGNTVNFKPVSFNNFVDSPLIAGAHFNRVDLDPGANAAVHLDVIADEADQVKVSDAQLKQHRELIQQAYKLFGTHHYDHYDFLLTLSDGTGHFGLEHHQSSDDRLPADMLTEAKSFTQMASLMPHEYVHSWCGKFRRPAKLWAPDFNTTEEDDLLWVYEGLTDYWAGVLTTRSGMWSADQYRDTMANIAAQMSARTGRDWRPLQDTADAAPLTYFGGGGWANWRRGTDFYPEGQLLWLDVDTKIRELSGGKRSLDDFAHAFFGMDPGSYVTKTYTFDDVVNTLNQVQPNDWKTFLRSRLDYTGSELPEKGIERGGWQLTYTDKPNAMVRDGGRRGGVNLAYSIGLSVGGNGRIGDVQWDGPAFKAGLVPGMTVVAVNGKDFSTDGIKDAVTAAKGTQTPIRLLVKNADVFSTVEVNYHDGLKYPHLVRAKGANLIDAITTTRK